MNDGWLMKSVVLGLVGCVLTTSVEAACRGRFLNPVTDICWSCLFPITLGGMKIVSGREDTKNPGDLVCFCPRPPLPNVPGIPVSFWEPARLVDVTRTPYCLVNLGGLQVAGDASHPQNQGAVSTPGGGSVRALKHSFYQVHWYLYPLIYWLELLVDFACLESGTVDLLYLSELDPFWADDETGFVINPEAVLFANPIAQAACAADCVATSLGFPLDALFWCGGCQGSLYPFSGNIAAHVGGVQGSLLAMQKMMAKLHREFLLWGTSGKKALCGKYVMPVIKKSQYKTQMTYPIPQTDDCMPLGRSDAVWSSGKEFPYQGEDFGYLIWRKRNCCML
jgi:conjugal transfer pilus assembly protein TraU